MNQPFPHLFFPDKGVGNEIAPARRPEADGDAVQRSLRRHALGWLLAANAVGVLLAAELLWPDLGDALAPFTYGRWMPLHLDWQLYGWCALPLVGVLLAWCLNWEHPRAARHARGALAAWSLALALGGVSWLGGVTSGKLFLDWHGWARPLLPLAMCVLWTVLAAHAWGWRRAASEGRGVSVGRSVLLLGLAGVPGLFYWVAGREVYPPVNPDSGGATGTSLLGSTLGIVAIFGLLPVLLKVGRPAGRATAVFWGAFAVSCAVCAGLEHGNASHHAPGQILGLGLLLGWVPLAWWYFRGFAWTPAARPWLAAAFGWWLLLVTTGWLTFLPGASERLKFTHGLVAHAHLAMAGLVTSMNFVILESLDKRRRGDRAARTGWPFWGWQTGCAAQVAALLALGWWERDYAGDLFRAEAWTQALYGVRLAAGGVMLAASACWWRRAWA